MEMKKSIINQIFNGQRGSSESFGVKSEQWEKATEAVIKFMEQMKKEFSPEHYALFQKFEDTFGILRYEECDAHYVEGFRIGVLVGIECAEE
jgi:hypothetical protein